MFCRNCGKEINSNARFCKYCGHPIEKKQELKYVQEPVVETHKVNYLSVIMGVGSLLLSVVLIMTVLTGVFSWNIPLLSDIKMDIFLTSIIVLIAIIMLVVSIVILKENFKTAKLSKNGHAKFDDPPVDDDLTEYWDPIQNSKAYLEYLDNNAQTRIPLNRRQTRIGRLANQVDFVVKNPRVGKTHADFIFQDGHYYVKDLNSKNGTYVNDNGRRIDSSVPYQLSDGDHISLADSHFIIHC